MKFNQKTFLSAIIIIIVLVGGGFLLVNNKQESKQKNTISTVEQKTQAKLAIKDGEKITSYDLKSVVGKTVLEATKEATGGKIVASGEGVNAFVTSINGRAASSEKKEFWELDINGKMSEVGAGTATVKEGDSIEWKISNY